MDENSEVNRRFGSAIKAERERRGWHQGRIAKYAGITTSYVSRIELGNAKNPASKVLYLICKALGLDLPQELERAGYTREAVSEAEVYILGLSTEIVDNLNTRLRDIEGALVREGKVDESLETVLALLDWLESSGIEQRELSLINRLGLCFKAYDLSVNIRTRRANMNDLREVFRQSQKLVELGEQLDAVSDNTELEALARFRLADAHALRGQYTLSEVEARRALSLTEDRALEAELRRVELHALRKQDGKRDELAQKLAFARDLLHSFDDYTHAKGCLWQAICISQASLDPILALADIRTAEEAYVHAQRRFFADHLVNALIYTRKAQILSLQNKSEFKREAKETARSAYRLSSGRYWRLASIANAILSEQTT